MKNIKTIKLCTQNIKFKPTEDAKSIFGDLTRIYNSDRISRATDMGMPARAWAFIPLVYIREKPEKIESHKASE
jgi:hypothetical protein